MRFKNFLRESLITENNVVELTYQKILDNIDTGHVDFDSDKIETDVGKLIKNSKVNVKLVIRKSNENQIRLGKEKESETYAIVVDTTKGLPKRDEIDKFISRDEELTQGIKDSLKTYFKNYHDENKDDVTTTNHEDQAEANTSQVFEDRYEVMIKELNQRLSEFKEMTENLRNELENTQNKGERETIKRAIARLAKDEFGEDLNGFLKVARGIISKGPEGENTGFANNLSKQNKERLHSRLENYYEQKIKPMLKY